MNLSTLVLPLSGPKKWTHLSLRVEVACSWVDETIQGNLTDLLCLFNR